MINAYITNRNLLTCTAKLAADLANTPDVRRVVILDCQSTYLPLLDWYASQDIAEVRMLKNLGNHAVWNHGEKLTDDGDEFYFATDSDIDLGDCPRDFISVLQQGLIDFPNAIKSALSLRLDDIPADSILGENAKQHEARFWSKPLNEHWYQADCDTAVCMYRAHQAWGGYGPAIRSRPPYQCRHLPWYIMPDEVDYEWRYYWQTLDCGGLHWSPLLRDQHKQ